MSVYSSDPFVWEKRAGRQALARDCLVFGARSPGESAVVPSSMAVCLSVSMGEYVNTYTAGLATCWPGWSVSIQASAGKYAGQERWV